MDVPDSRSPEAVPALAAEPALSAEPDGLDGPDGPDGPRLEAPASLPESSGIDHERRRPAGPLPSRPSRIKGGPIAAFVATVLVLGVTAIPAGAPGSYRDGPSPAAPRSSQDVGPVSDLPQLLPIDLGADYGAFALEGAPIWTDRADGTAAVSLSLRSVVDPSGSFTGKFVMRRPESVRTLDRDVVVADEDGITGFDPMRQVRSAQRQESTATAYLALVGELEGAGTLAGTLLTIRNAPGGVVRRGPWRLDDDRDSVETVFARLFWMRSASGLGSADADRADEGTGSLALQLAPPASVAKRAD